MCAASPSLYNIAYHACPLSPSLHHPTSLSASSFLAPSSSHKRRKADHLPMSDTQLRRRIPATARKSRPPHPTRSPHGRTPPTPRHSKPHKPIKRLQRCSSEPILWTVGLIEADQNHHHHHQQTLLFRPQTCTDVFTSPLRSLSPSPYSFHRYSDDSKVVVNVTLEGSPGPVRTLVRLGATVEDTIKLVINRYSEEGRTPRLDVEAASEFELHHSYFSLESMNKTERIGEMGSRNFFLRRSCSSRSSSNFDDEGDGRRRGTDNAASSREEIVNANPPPQLFLSFIARRISKIGRRTKKIWNILGCMSCG
ncbi:uncharacterized protein At4g22758-like [Magnolia sinica]|uniref:uncharacterized protein At4g22758-like n=1 Tax=Magnolia sinica TaxID=86752 RepID=UPI0026592309|nr:uncharacterized protein At4g22758-like [Magnolia sinica]